MKLISMTDFVLQVVQTPNVNEAICWEQTEARLQKIYQYSLFLKQPLKLEMFVPVSDEDGNFLEEPDLNNTKYDINISEVETDINYRLYDDDVLQYQQAKEKVMFNGWFMDSEDCVFKLKDGALSIIDFDSNYTIEDFCENDEESRILTQNAIKQLGL